VPRLYADRKEVDSGETVEEMFCVIMLEISLHFFFVCFSLDLKARLEMWSMGGEIETLGTRVKFRGCGLDAI